jgi:hypothetical protein
LYSLIDRLLRNAHISEKMRLSSYTWVRSPEFHALSFVAVFIRLLWAPVAPSIFETDRSLLSLSHRGSNLERMHISPYMLAGGLGHALTDRQPSTLCADAVRRRCAHQPDLFLRLVNTSTELGDKSDTRRISQVQQAF